MTATADPTPAAERRALGALIASNFLMWGGFFMIVPVISVHFVENLGWAAALVGVVLAARQLAQQGLTVFGGALSDRLGPRGLILTGMLLRAVSFAAMAWTDTFWALLGAGVLAGASGALFDAPKNAAVAALTTPERRARVFSLMSVFGNLGMVTGPALGALLLRVDFALVAFAAGAAFLIAFLITALTLPPMRPDRVGGGALSGLGVVLRDARFVRYTALLMGYWALWVQLSIALPIRAAELGGAGGVGWVYGVNAGLAIALQYPLVRFLEKRVPLEVVLVTGVSVAAVGLALVAAAGTFPALLACVALFSLGAMLANPVQQTLTARMSQRGLTGSYFGVGALSLGVGGAAGNLAGGVLHDLAALAGMPAVPWLLLGALGAVTALGLARLLRVTAPLAAPASADS